ncbi:MAG: hypothetical protein LIO62_02760, partial [Clostridiales bacterium]|nr:hypothetical protein [Clostridiales bacterium]
MKDKFIRILSPITIAVVAVLDVAVIAYGIFAIQKLIYYANARTIFFTACEAVAFVVAILVTKDIFSNGVKFFDDEMEFTGLDDNNIFAYENIAQVETEKDIKASLVKNFVDRQSRIILTLKNDEVITIDIGLTTKGTLEKIKNEIDT